MNRQSNFVILKNSNSLEKRSGFLTGTRIVGSKLTRLVPEEWVNAGLWEFSCAEKIATPNSSSEVTLQAFANMINKVLAI